MTFIFKNRTIFWDISKWNRGQKKWDGGSTKSQPKKIVCEIVNFGSTKLTKQKKKIYRNTTE